MYRHYIVLNNNNCIIDGWSAGEKSGIGLSEHGALLTDQGDYYFSINGLINPPLFTDDNIPVYKWNGKTAELRTEQEIEEERNSQQNIME